MNLSIISYKNPWNICCHNHPDLLNTASSFKRIASFIVLIHILLMLEMSFDMTQIDLDQTKKKS